MSDKYITEPMYGSKRRCSCCKFICICLLTLIILLGIAVLVLYLLLKPKAPSYDVTNVSISQFRVFQAQNSSNSLSPFLNLTMDIGLTAKNPNRVKIKVNNATVGLYYKGQFVGNADVPGFEQGKKSEQVVHIPVVLSKVDVLAQGTQLIADINNGTVAINADTKLSGKITIWGITSPSFGAKVICDLYLDILGQKLKNKDCSYSVAL